MNENIAVALIEALKDLAWPILAALVLWKIYPSLQGIMETRGFTVKVGDMEVSVQDVSDQLRVQLEDLQEKVASLRQRLDERGSEPTEPETGAPRETPLFDAAPPKHILWVDDKPSNNAYEIAKIRDDGVEVVKALSTTEAMDILTRNQSIDAIISDMGREEDGEFRAKAGIQLIEAVRNAEIDLPIFVYTAPPAYAQKIKEEVIAMGGNGVTASPVELFEMLRPPTR